MIATRLFRIPVLPLVLGAVLLGGCATTPAPHAPLSTATVAPYRATINLSGRLSVNYEKDGQPETLTGSFTWAQQGQRVEVSLASPFGQTLARIVATPEGASLIRNGEPPRTAPDIDRLSAEILGWELPVAGLRDWLQGYAHDAQGRPFVAAPAHSAVTTPSGWHLHYVSWQDPDAAQPQPKRIDATRPASAGAQALSIRIVLDPSA